MIPLIEVWDEAKIEWIFTNAYQSNSPQTCLCGHHPIKNICVITNKKMELEPRLVTVVSKIFLEFQREDA